MQKTIYKTIPIKKLNKQAKEHLEFQKRLGNHDAVIVEDKNGTWRFKPNTVIEWLHIHLPLPAPWNNGLPLNDMWGAHCNKHITTRDFAIFYSQFGYSLGGYEEIWGDLMDKVLNAKSKKEIEKVLENYERD